MQHRLLGKTGLRVSEIAFGGAEIGLPYGHGVKSEADMISERDAIALLHESLEAGITFFDTARLYGLSEARMGQAFRDRRQRVVLATKSAHFRNDDGSIPALPVLRARVEASLTASLAALQTDYVDLFMLHSSDQVLLENGDVLRVFEDVKRRGLVRHAGASIYTVAEARAALATGIWEVIQLPFNLMDQRQEAVFAEAVRLGVGLVVRSVLLRGLLTEKGRNLHPALAAVERHLGTYQALLGEAAPDLPTLATRFALSFPEVTSILVGIDHPDYLRRSLAAANGRYFDASRLDRAKALAYPDPDFINLPHWDKMGWT